MIGSKWMVYKERSREHRHVILSLGCKDIEPVCEIVIEVVKDEIVNGFMLILVVHIASVYIDYIYEKIPECSIASKFSGIILSGLMAS